MRAPDGLAIPVRGDPNQNRRRHRGINGVSNQRVKVMPNDLYYKPYEHPDASEEDMRGYLDWEVGLVQQRERDGSAKYRVFLNRH